MHEGSSKEANTEPAQVGHPLGRELQEHVGGSG